MDHIVLEPERKTSGCWSRKFEFQLHSPGCSTAGPKW